MENQYKIRSPFFYAVMRLISNRAALVSGVLLFLIVLMAIFTLLITKTALGRAQRACEQDRTMTALMGINVDRTIQLHL